ncbi:MAG: PAS domain S-box protein [Rhodothermales bacterium]
MEQEKASPKSPHSSREGELRDANPPSASRDAGDALRAPCRLDALHRSGLLGTEPEEAFDRIARLAARVLRAPVALVTLVDPQRQFMKSAVGLAHRRTLPLSHSFCQHVVARSAPFVVVDTAEIPLVRDNLAKDGIEVGAYLGVPFRTPQGEVLGSLCVLDTVPRAWSDADQDTLLELAAVLTDELVRREHALQLDEQKRKHAARQALVQASTDTIADLFFVLDLDARLVEWNRSVEEVSGYSEDEIRQMQPTDFFDEPDQVRVLEAIERVIRTGSAVVEAVGVMKDGRRIPYEFYGTALSDDAGALIGLCGTARDITERQQSYEALQAQTQALREANDRFEAVVNNVPGVVFQCIVERDGTFSFPFVRSGLGRDVGLDLTTLEEQPEELVPLLHATVHPDDVASLFASLASNRTAMTPWTWEGRTVGAGEVRWLSAHAHPTQLSDGRLRWNGVVLDVTAQKQTEEELRLSESRHRGLVEATPDLFFRISRSGTILDLNASDPTLLQSTVEEVLNRAVTEVLSAPLAERLLAAIGLALDSGRLQEVDYDLTTRSGDVRHFEARIVPTGADEVQAIVRDVSERYAAARALRESELRFRSFVEATAQVVWVADATGEVTELSSDWSAFTGQSAEEVAGWGWAEALHPDDAPRVTEEWTAHLADRTPYTTVYRVRRHDGPYHRFYVRAVPVHNGSDFLGWVGTCADIEEQKQDQEALHRSEERLRLALDAARMGTWDVDLRTQETVWSAQTFALYGITAPLDLKETTFYDLLTADDQGRVRAATEIALQQAAEGETPQLDHEYQISRPDGEARWFRSIGRIRLDEDGRPVRMLGIVLDVTDERAHEQALVEAAEAADAARQHAEEAARLKSTLLANMSHEIRTPLTGIIGFAEVLAEESARLDPGGDHEEFAWRIGQSGRRLLETLNSVLDLAQLEAGQRRVDLAETDVREVISTTAALLQQHADEKGIALDVALPPSPVRLFTDEGALGRVVTNLVSNAIKFTKAGHVAVTLTERDEGVEIRVADTGIGIRASFLPLLFEAFRQESEGEGRRFEGNGLGLAITQRLVQMLGGTISVESEENAGTVFTVLLPYSRSERETAAR